MSAIDAILNHGASVTSASLAYGIKRTSLHLYLKKLNIRKNKIRVRRHPPMSMPHRMRCATGGGGASGSVQYASNANVKAVSPIEPDCILFSTPDLDNTCTYYPEDDDDDEDADEII